jgi:hypothetical protein
MNLLANVDLSCYLSADSQRSMMSIHSTLKAHWIVTIAYIRRTLDGCQQSPIELTKTSTFGFPY